MTENITNTQNEQNPQILRRAIEQSIIDLTFSEKALAEYLTFGRGGTVEHTYKPFAGCLRDVVGLTLALQEVTDDDPIVKQVTTHLEPKNTGMWDDTNEKPAEEFAREGLALAQKYRRYLGSKGIISINR